MPHAEINAPGLILVGRFSGDPHWPVLGDPWGRLWHRAPPVNWRRWVTQTWRTPPKAN